ncbi:hypothetical protein [Gloeobacter kilaueensis]|uniref:Uncharacterized protein n=1 Tax=Gloeobacter kilaueensis (strain ATCC BAA-2537 / CCAP 1431/1 / ULC 316 / JS1) TaxID=1183438 RepID=U5QSA3_GLOK1|nr:hypothetical protein [Gloeobacter kilaueensis]AGY60524.1 hypothetical protein GKIL_4278 [Gloeobacter kilaueensis JS1]
MSTELQRLEVFRRLPLGAQRTFIAATRASEYLAADTGYLESLEQVHRECLAAATPEQLARYRQPGIEL